MSQNRSRTRVRETYSIPGETYDQHRLVDDRGGLLSEHDRALFRAMLPPLPAGARVLEVGAGTGRFTLPALERGISLVASDINPSLLASLRRKVEEAGFGDRCELREEDVFQLSDPDESFDLVFTLHVLPRFSNFEDQRAALEELARVLRPGGRLLFNFRGSRSFYNLFYGGHSADPRAIERVLAAAGLRVVEKRAKWLLNRRLINAVGVRVARALAGLDRALQRTAPDWGWDVFVLAEKSGP